MKKKFLLLLGISLVTMTTFANRKIEMEADLIEPTTRSTVIDPSASKPNADEYIYADIDNNVITLDFIQLSGAYVTMAVYDSSGNTVFSKNAIAGSASEVINLSNCGSGEYTLEIISAKFYFLGSFHID
ncbi:MAG: DUF3244 domain-containing protein [Tannerella sp.]|jgi:hypothetical protein|nr:DUF3244 domain-containing protein [Tannerella sp.]